MRTVYSVDGVPKNALVIAKEFHIGPGRVAVIAKEHLTCDLKSEWIVPLKAGGAKESKYTVDGVHIDTREIARRFKIGVQRLPMIAKKYGTNSLKSEWLVAIGQGKNTRKKYTLDGVVMTVDEISDKLRVSATTVISKKKQHGTYNLKSEMFARKTFLNGKRSGRKYTLDGVPMPTKQIIKILQCTYKTVEKRYEIYGTSDLKSVWFIKGQDYSEKKLKVVKITKYMEREIKLDNIPGPSKYELEMFPETGRFGGVMGSQIRSRAAIASGALPAVDNSIL